MFKCRRIGSCLCRRVATTSRVPQSKVREQPINGYYVIYPEIDENSEAGNKLLQSATEHTLPPFESVDVATAQSAAVTAAMSYGGGVGEHAERFVDPRAKCTFDTVLAPLQARLEQLVYTGLTARQQSLYADANAVSLPVQLKANRVASALIAQQNELNVDPVLHRAVREVHSDAAHQTPWQARLVACQVADGRLCGMELDDAQRSQLTTTQSVLSDFEYQVTHNLMLNYAAFNSPVTDAAQLADAPPHVRSALAPRRSTDAAVYENGPWSVHLHPASFWPFMRYCSSRDRRQNAHDNWSTRASFKHMQSNNSIMLEEMRYHRSLVAETLGYENYAEMVVANRMAGSVNTVRAFLDSLRENMKPTFVRSWEAAQSHANKHDQVRTQLTTHDLFYYGRKHPLVTRNVDELALSAYFPFKEVLSRLMTTLGAALGMQFTEVTSERSIERWHKDVRVFTVHDTDSDTPLGHVYVDSYARDARRPGWEAVAARATQGHKIVYLNCYAFAKANGDDATLHWTELRALCREFGRTLSYMASGSPYVHLIGMNGTDADCIEAVPLVFEKMLTDASFVRALSGNAAGEQLSSEAAVTACKAMAETQLFETYRTVMWADYDIQLNAYKVRTEKFWVDLYRELWAEYMPYASDKNDFTPCTFTPLLTGRMSAAYYAKLWAEMLACDMLSHMRASSPSGVLGATAGMAHFKQTMLVEGGARSMKHAFRHYADRDPSVTPLIEHYTASLADSAPPSTS